MSSVCFTVNLMSLHVAIIITPYIYVAIAVYEIFRNYALLIYMYFELHRICLMPIFLALLSNVNKQKKF